MDIQGFIHRHWLDIVLLPANILTVDVIIKGAAEKRNFKQVSQICDWIANIVGFVQDIIVGLIQRKQLKGGSDASNSTGSGDGSGNNDVSKGGQPIAK